jgi:hypothetical protein
MPHAQPDLRALVKRIRDLQATFLPVPNPTGSYSSAEYDQTAAFLLLVHAEVEWFLERRCLTVADTAVSSWLADLKARQVIVSLAGMADDRGFAALPKPGTRGKPALVKLVDEAKGVYSKRVHLNNGLKEGNLLEMLIPIGISEADLPATFVADMNSFGSQRGDQAHRGVGARKPTDPRDALKLVARVLRVLRRLDLKLHALASE